MNHRFANENIRKVSGTSFVALALCLGAAANTPSHADEPQARASEVADLRMRVLDLEQELTRQRENGAQAADEDPGSAPASPQAPKPGGPGSFKVDEMAAERALERTLTAEGALLLQPGRFLVEPYFTYARRESNTPILIEEQLNASSFALEVLGQDTRRNEFDAGVRILAGLPFGTQLELNVPYRWVEQSDSIPGLNETSTSADTIGDIKLGVAATLLRERDWLPDLVGRITWDTDTGDRFDKGISTGIGYQELRVGLTALKRQDPLVFTGGINYTYAYEKDDIQPGDEWQISVGTSLAASPETALSLGLVQSFVSETEVNGRRLEGTDQVSSLLVLGASSIVARNTLLAFTLGVGLTNDAPDYFFNVALPVQF
jgi:hypothetical protein